MDKKQLLEELKSEGFSEDIIKAFEQVKREDFVPENLKEFSYIDEPLSIGKGQTISQPYTIAFMLNLLELKDNLKILEIGSGSGYVLALINELSKNSKIYGIERIKELAEISREVLKNKNTEIVHGDGSKGLKQHALYDRILVSAAADKIPKKLLEQLNYNGILVIPVRNSIISIKKLYRENKIKEYPGFVFVPLIEE
ncbi:MAG: protein-L-isoaspartate(D-aspartate) O-methyltransferase [Nanoarchaeota archaeon]|nr:protein-L-isoaspartate(D-aspartate) O-methyltransferase [Nanoarchaeota archaeon]